MVLVESSGWEWLQVDREIKNGCLEMVIKKEKKLVKRGERDELGVGCARIVKGSVGVFPVLSSRRNEAWFYKCRMRKKVVKEPYKGT